MAEKRKTVRDVCDEADAITAGYKLGHPEPVPASAAAGEEHAEKAKQMFVDAGGMDIPGDDSDIVPLGEGHATRDRALRQINGALDSLERGVIGPVTAVPAIRGALTALGEGHAREGLSREEIEAWVRRWEGLFEDGDFALLESMHAKLRGWLASPAPEGDGQSAG